MLLCSEVLVWLRDLYQGQRGQSVIECGLILALAAIVTVATLKALGTSILLTPAP